MAGERPHILFEPGRVRVAARGVSAIKSGGSGRGLGHGGAGGQGRGRGGGAGIGHLVAAFGAIASVSAQGVPSPPDVSALTLLSTTTLGGSGTIDVSGISQAFNDLIVVTIARGTTASDNDTLALRFNNDSGTNYWQQWTNNQSAAITLNTSTGANNLEAAHTIPANTAPANLFGMSEVTIYGYASTAWQKTITGIYCARYNTTAATIRSGETTGTWLSTAAITRLTLFGNSAANLAAGSVCRIYGRT